MTTYRYCSKCGGPLTARLMEGRERLVCDGCGFVLYVNPRPATCAVVVEGDRVMLVRRAVEPRRGFTARRTSITRSPSTTTAQVAGRDRKSTRLNSSHSKISY